MVAKEEHSERVQELMSNPKNIRNIGIVAHIHHGKTALTDNLAAKAGLIAEKLAGVKMLTWIDPQEHERLMTIYGATVTMPYEYEGQPYLINLFDTPGHVDFGADVTQAMRVVDGSVVVVCAVEGVMPQTETVLKQALAERVKPVLFINKVDRAIKELKLSSEALQKRLANIVIEVNKFIQAHVEPQFKDKWIVRVEDGSVAFGSAVKRWATSAPAMKKFGVSFKDIIELCSQDKDELLAEKTPLHAVVMDMIIKHLPSPIEAQPYRIPRIWKGDIESAAGKSLTACDVNSNLIGTITKVVYDQRTGMICTARVFAGKLTEGQDVYMNNAQKNVKVQQITTFIANTRIPVSYVLAGNIVGLIGINDAFVGETISNAGEGVETFEAIKHVFEPVVTKSIEPKSPQDLPKLIDILKTLSREDPTLKIQVNQETGETLVSGLGELHLDAKVERKIKEKGVEIIASPPIVVYRETISGASPTIEAKSPNKHNKFYLSVESLPQEIYRAMAEGQIKDGEVKGKHAEAVKKLQELGMDKDLAKCALLVLNRCIFFDTTKGAQYLNEAIELIKDGFREAIEAGPLAKEPCSAIIVKLSDVELHEDAVHRGPAQVIPAVRQSIHECMRESGALMLEPKQILRIDIPQEYIGGVTAEINNRRGEIIDVKQEEQSAVVTAKMPVAEMFGFEGQLKSATGGKGFQSLMDVVFEKMPRELLQTVVAKIRERKGLPKEISGAG